MLSIAERAAFLKETELFTDVSEDDLRGVAEVAQEKAFTDGEIVVREGEKGDAVYFIIRGQVSIHKSGVEIIRRGEKEFIGEVAVIDDGPRSSSMSSIRDSLLLKISRDDFYRAIEGNAKLLKNVLNIVLAKFRKDIDREVEAVRARERMAQDLLRASELQTAMLPTQDLNFTTPEGISVVVSGSCYPADTVGGDYYDYFALPDGKLCLVIGDVMGHGFHTGLMVSTAISCLHTQIRSDYSIGSVMSAMDDMVYEFVHGSLYMSFCYIIVDLKDHTVSFCNAGHPYPYHYRAGAGQLEKFKSDYLPLGTKIFKDEEYEANLSDWKEDDILVLYTDGLTEAENPGKECFGEERLKRLIIENTLISPAELKESILHELDKFCQSVTREDDVTLVTVKLFGQKA
jgi:sigma-B regulation protein RsbU (phosphoserine phosphatase)